MDYEEKQSSLIFQRIEIGKKLLAYIKHFPECIAYRSPTGFYPFQYAAYLNKYNTLELLYDIDKEGQYSNDYIKGPEDMNALHLAVSRNSIETTKFLLKHFYDPSIKCKDGLTALHVAVREGSLECVKILLFYNDNNELINKKTDASHTALHFAAFNNYYKIVLILLLFGADSKIKDYQNNTALDLAIKKNSKESIDILTNFTKIKIDLEEKFNIIISTFQRMDVSPNFPKLFLLTVIKDNPLLVEYFKTSDGLTLLHYASIYGRFNSLELLLQYTTNPDQHDRKWNTPLMVINNQQYERIFDAFIEKGANINSLNIEGYNVTSYKFMSSKQHPNEQFLFIIKHQPNLLSSKIDFLFDNKLEQIPLLYIFASDDKFNPYLFEGFSLKTKHSFSMSFGENELTALKVAYWKRAFNNFKFLILKASVCPFMKNKEIYFDAAKDPSRIEYLKIILQYKGIKDILVTDENGKTALECAREYNNKEAVMIIKQALKEC